MLNYCYSPFPFLSYVLHEVNHVTLSRFLSYIVSLQSDVATS